MLRTRPLLVAPLLALMLVVGLTATELPAVAAAKRPSITLKASPKTVAINTTVTLTGKVSGKSPGTRVKLQRRTGGTWKTLKSTKVTRSKAYRFRTTIRDSRTAFRVKVVKNTKLKAATSRTVQVTGTPVDDTARTLILRKTNEFRAQNGRSPLALMPELNTIAQKWSTHMATTSEFGHNPNYVASYPAGWTAAAENIAAGQQVDEVVNSWINSPGHRKNLLGDYNYIGIGYATGGEYGRYYTQNFGKYPRR